MNRLTTLVILFIALNSYGQIIKTTVGGIPAYAQFVGTNKPSIIFLHGIGERGTDLEFVMRYGPLAMLKAGSTEKHLIDCNIVHLQLGKDKSSWPREYIANAIKDLITRGADPNRIYLLGVSLGGAGVWNCLTDTNINKYLAAGVLMAPGGSPGGKEQIIADSRVPLWIAHGKNDLVVSFATSESAFKKINSLRDGQALLTHMGLGGHNTGSSWGRFMEPENYYLWDWLFKQNRLGDELRLEVEIFLQLTERTKNELQKLLIDHEQNILHLDSAIHK